MQDHVSLQDALNAMTEQIAILSGDGVIVAANTAWQDHFWTHQSGSHDFVGHQFGDALRSVHGVSESDTGRILEGIGHVLRGRLPGFEVEYQEGRDEEARWFLMSATPLTQGHKGALITRRDITRQKAREADLLVRANSDALTGLSNRSYFMLEASHMLALAKRHAWHPALIYLDIDNFKGINDQHGHAVGDVVLGRVGARLRRLTRESDLLARLGGDEFVVLVNNVTVLESARIVRVYRRSLAQPPIIDGMPIIIQGSFGVAHYPVDGVTIEAMLAVADRAMYAAKSSWARRARRRGSGTMHARTENRASL